MNRESDRFARSSHAPAHRALAALLALTLLWVPAAVRVAQPLVAAHAIGALSKISKSAVLPHDPVTSLPFVAAPRALFPVAAPSVAVEDLDIPRVIDHARDAVGLRAPPALAL